MFYSLKTSYLLLSCTAKDMSGNCWGRLAHRVADAGVCSRQCWGGETSLAGWEDWGKYDLVAKLSTRNYERPQVQFWRASKLYLMEIPCQKNCVSKWLHLMVIPCTVYKHIIQAYIYVYSIFICHHNNTFIKKLTDSDALVPHAGLAGTSSLLGV